MANRNKFVRFLRTRGYWGHCIRFLFDRSLKLSFFRKFALLKRLYGIHFAVENIPHSQKQILIFVQAILRAPRDTEGVVIEAGCFKGISSAKFSAAAALSIRICWILSWIRDSCSKLSSAKYRRGGLRKRCRHRCTLFRGYYFISPFKRLRLKHH